MMANYETSADLKADILFRGGELATGSDFDAEVLRLLNRAYFSICSGGGELNDGDNPNWIWLRPTYPGDLNLEVAITAGTVAITQDASALTFSSAPVASVAGWLIKIGTDGTAYRISAHTAGQANATIRGTFTGSTVTAASYTCFKLDYDLTSGMLRPISPMTVFQFQASPTHPGFVDGIGVDEMARDYPLRTITAGVPEKFAVVKQNTATDTYTVRFNKYVTSRVLLQYDYLEVPTVLADDTTEPRVPRLLRYVLADFALYLLALQKEDDRVQLYTDIASRGFKALVQEDEKRIGDIASEFGFIAPREDLLTRRGRGVLRTESGLIIG